MKKSVGRENHEVSILRFYILFVACFGELKKQANEMKLVLCVR